METSLEKVAENRVKLAITLSPEEVEQAIADSYAKWSSQVRVAGFRSGKAPRSMIDTHVGKERVLATALESLVEESYPRALSAEKLRPIELPDVGTLDALEPGEPYTFHAEFEVRPELQLESTKNLSIVMPPAKTEEREIDAQIGHLRDRFATLEVVEDRGVQADDFVLISFTGTIDGEPYEGNTVDRYLYEMGSGQMPAEFDEAMLGAAPGASVTASFAVPETSGSPEFIGKTAAFEITVHEIKSKVLPELDSEFASNAGGFATMQEMRDDIRKRLDENKEAGRIRQMERASRDALMSRLVGEVPKVLVESRTERLMEEFLDTLKERDITPEQYVEATGVDPESIREDVAQQAALQVKDELALEALCRAEGIEVSAEDIQAEIARMAEDQKSDVPSIMKRIEDAAAMPLLIEEIMHRKGVRWLMDNVEIVEEAPAAQESGSAGVAANQKSAKPAAGAKPAKAARTQKKEQPAEDAPASSDGEKE